MFEAKLLVLHVCSELRAGVRGVSKGSHSANHTCHSLKENRHRSWRNVGKKVISKTLSLVLPADSLLEAWLQQGVETA